MIRMSTSVICHAVLPDCLLSVHCCGIHVFYSSIRCTSPSLVLVALLQAAAAHCELLFADPVDLSYLWLSNASYTIRGVCRADFFPSANFVQQYSRALAAVIRSYQPKVNPAK